MALELRQLRALVAVVDEGTFTDAAIALGASQASVSRAVAALERALGARVLQRTSHGAVVTAAGAPVVARARTVLAEVAALEREAGAPAGELRIGYAWSALGQHTTPLHRRWALDHPGSSLVFVNVATPTAGLVEGAVRVAVTRRPLRDRRFATALVGVEARCAALPADSPLARRRSVAMSDLAGTTIGVDHLTGTTSLELWPAGAAPAAVREVRGVDEWLTLIAAGRAVGVTSEATARQHPRPGIAYRRVRDAPPVPVHLAWWRDDEPTQVADLVAVTSELYASAAPVARTGAPARR